MAENRVNLDFMFDAAVRKCIEAALPESME
jgi:hypothetical protein